MNDTYWVHTLPDGREVFYWSYPAAERSHDFRGGTLERRKLQPGDMMAGVSFPYDVEQDRGAKE